MTNIPTLQELYDDIKADLQAGLSVIISSVGKVYLRALNASQAARLKLYYLRLGFIQKNIFVDTADSESIGGTLERFGRVKLNRNPFPAVPGQYTVNVTGDIGAIIPANQTFKSDDESENPGFLFVLDTAYTFVAPTGTITLRALTPGLESLLAVGDTLTATSPISLVDRSAEIAAVSTPPQSAESLEIYRQRALEAYRLEAQGGAGTDYRLWSGDVQSIRTVYAYVNTGQVNEVNVFVEATPADSVPPDSGIPTAAILSDVVDAIELDPDTSLPIEDRGRRPIQVGVNVLPVAPLDVEIEITGYLNLTPAIELSITNALTDFIYDIRPFMSGTDPVADRNDRLDVNGVIVAIQQAQPSGFFDSLILRVDGNPVSLYQFLYGEIPLPPVVTFV
jgi:uncharacterized phage protein gp47/JayE